MDTTLSMLEEVEALIVKAEGNLKKLEAMRLDQIAERVRTVFDQTEDIRRNIRSEKKGALTTLAKLADKVDKCDYSIGSKLYKVSYDTITVQKGPKLRHQENLSHWELIDSEEHWSFELLRAMTTAIAESVSRLPAEQSSLAEEISELIKLGEEFAKLSK